MYVVNIFFQFVFCLLISLMCIFNKYTYYKYLYMYVCVYLYYMNINIYKGSPGGSVIKNLPANAGEMCSVPWLGRSPGGGNGNQLQYSSLGNLMDRGAW